MEIIIARNDPKKKIIFLNKRLRKQKKLSKMDNPETVPILRKQHTGRRKTNQQKTHHRTLKRCAARTHQKSGVNQDSREG